MRRSIVTRSVVTCGVVTRSVVTRSALDGHARARALLVGARASPTGASPAARALVDAGIELAHLDRLRLPEPAIERRGRAPGGDQGPDLIVLERPAPDEIRALLDAHPGRAVLVLDRPGTEPGLIRAGAHAWAPSTEGSTSVLREAVRRALAGGAARARVAREGGADVPRRVALASVEDRDVGAGRTDPVFGLLTPEAFAAALGERIGAVDGPCLSILLAELDAPERFESVDGGRLHHDALARLVRTLQATVRAGDPIARLGRHRFVVLLDGADALALERVARRATAAFARAPLLHRGVAFTLRPGLAGATLGIDAPRTGSAAELLDELVRAGAPAGARGHRASVRHRGRHRR